MKRVGIRTVPPDCSERRHKMKVPLAISGPFTGLSMLRFSFSGLHAHSQLREISVSSDQYISLGAAQVVQTALQSLTK